MGKRVRLLPFAIRTNQESATSAILDDLMKHKSKKSARIFLKRALFQICRHRWHNESADTLLLFFKGTRLTDPLGRTPLHIACASGNIRMVDRLVREEGANLNATDDRGLTPLHYASAHGHRRIASLLIDRGARMDARSNVYEWSPLHFACANGHLRLAATLINRGAKIEVRTYWRSEWPPLHLALLMRQEEVGEMLIVRGADPGAKGSRNGWTAKNCIVHARKNIAEKEECSTDEEWIAALTIRREVTYSLRSAMLFKDMAWDIKVPSSGFSHASSSSSGGHRPSQSLA